MKSAPLAALLCVLAASAAWAVDPAPRTEEEQKTDELNRAELEKAQGGAPAAPAAPAANSMAPVDHEGKPLSEDAIAKLPPEARWAMEQKNPDGTTKYKPIVGPDGAVLGYESGNMCMLPGGIAEQFALSQGQNQAPPPAETAAGAADQSQLGAAARGAAGPAPREGEPGFIGPLQNPTAYNNPAPTEAGAEIPGQAAPAAPPSNTSAPDYVAAMGDFLYNQNNPPDGTPSYDSAAAFDGSGNGRGGDSGEPRATSSGGSPNIVSDGGTTPTGGPNGAIADGSPGTPGGTGLGGAEVKCKTRAECEAVAKSYKETAEGADLGYENDPKNKPPEVMNVVQATAHVGAILAESQAAHATANPNGLAVPVGTDDSDAIKANADRPYSGNGRVLDAARVCAKDAKVHEALGTAGKVVKKGC